MNAFVVDTNVAVVANGRSDQATSDCVLACVEALETVTAKGMVVLDDRLRILSEYMDNLSLSGQPGTGDAFLKWVWKHQAVAERCERVPIRPMPGDGQDFEEFPRDDDLAGFDRADRKFVAVALGSQHKPAILNAVDSDWWRHRAALNRNGVNIRFLCPDLITRSDRRSLSPPRRRHNSRKTGVRREKPPTT